MAKPAIQIDSHEVRELLASSPARLNRAMRGGMNDATALLLREERTYPPERSSSTYTRTHILERSWSREISGEGLSMRGIVGSNENIAPYNREVQDAERQAAIHRGTWTNTVQAVTARNETRVNGMFDARFRAELEG